MQNRSKSTPGMYQIVVTTLLSVALFLTPISLFAASSVRHPRVSRMATAKTASTSLPLAPKQTQIEDVDSFIVNFVDGISSCRKARPEEVPSTLRRPGDVGVPVEHLLRSKSAPGGDNATSGLTINLVALPQLQSDPNMATVVAAFQRAAAVWTAQIKSPVTISIDIEYGVNMPGGQPFTSGVLGSTTSKRTLIDYPGLRTNLLAGSSIADTAVYNLLPLNSFVPTDAGNGGVVRVNRSVAFALGIPVTTPADQNVAIIGFNKNFSFDFNPDNGITPGQMDFVAVAAHEIGHALGFTSGSGGGATSEISIWDIFRFRPGTASSTAQRVMSIGGEQVYFTGESFTIMNVPMPTNELGLSTGGPDGDSDGGDGNQSSHWKADELNGGRFIGIMDPTISAGVREDATENDFKALETIGWNRLTSTPPPPPPPAPLPPPNDNFANAQVLTGCSGSVNGASVGATSETGEPNHEPGNHGGDRSVWYQWQSPSSGSVTVTTLGSRYDTVLAVYTGNAVSSLTPLGKSDDVSSDERTSSVTFTAVAGTTYRIAVDGYDNFNSGGDFGPLTLNWTATNCVAAPLQLLLEQSGPTPTQAAALDAVLFLRDPFPVINSNNLFNPISDPYTRVVIFVTNLQPSAAVVVNLIDSNNQTHNIPAEDVRPVPNSVFTQVKFALKNLPVGTCTIRVSAQSQLSNSGTIRIRSN